MPEFCNGQFITKKSLKSAMVFEKPYYFQENDNKRKTGEDTRL